MASKARGPLLHTYRPIPANPMTVALLLLLAVVTFVIGPIAAWPEGLWPVGGLCFVPLVLILAAIAVFKPSPTLVFENGIDRKSTRLNSSHSQISYAVFCLKKRKADSRPASILPT